MTGKIHLIGIGGIGVSGLAGILLKQGNRISGSDKENSPLMDKLAGLGAKILVGHSADNIRRLQPDFVVHSLAIDSSNPELKEARRLKIPVLTYPEAVGELTKSFFTIAICGTHGKSTVTAMIAKILMENGFDPTVIVGTKLKELGDTNYRVGGSKLLILESCEYKRAFLNYNPRIIVLHTLDPDHLDYYKDFEDYITAFKDFTKKLPSDGYMFSNLDDEDVHSILQEMQKNKFPQYNSFTYSSEYSGANFYLNNNQITGKNIKLGKLNLKIPGKHNRTNALAAFSVASALGIAPRKILHSLNNYAGAYRRFEYIGKIGRTTVIDDYAHHPEEIKASLAGAREAFKNKRICAVFQPHQYNRTKNLLKEFGKAFKDADMVIIPNIYEVRDTEKDKASVSAEILVKEIGRSHPRVLFGNGMIETAKFLKENAKNWKLILTMGAGDVWKIAKDICRAK